MSEVAYNIAAGGSSEEAVHTGVSNPWHKTATTAVMQASEQERKFLEL